MGIVNCGYPSIAVDRNCSAHIAYQENASSGNVFYYTNASGTWQRDTIFIGPLNKTISVVDRSICVDDLGYVHVSFSNQISSTRNGYEIYHAVSDTPAAISTSPVSFQSQNVIYYQITPNPFRNKTNIKIQFSKTKNQYLKNGGQVTLYIYDATGKLIKIIQRSTIYGLPHTDISWYGKDNYGNDVCPGIYFCALKLEKEKYTRKMLLLK